MRRVLMTSRGVVATPVMDPAKAPAHTQSLSLHAHDECMVNEMEP